MTLDEFRAQTEGRQIDLDHYPVAQPFQCVDLASDYMLEVAGGNRFTGDYAKDMYGEQSDRLTWEKNTASNFPAKGAVFVYGARPGDSAGHIAVVLAADVNTVTLLEQNVIAPRVTVGTHGYSGAIGWGTPTINVNPTPVTSGGRYQATRVCNVRVAPRLSAPLGGSQVLHVGDWFDAAGVVTGDTFDGDNRWVHSLRGNYVWEGNLKKIG